MASPKSAAVYVDGFYAGIVDDFDGLFQPLPLLPGGHTIALYLEGYRTVNKSVYLTPGSTLKLHEDLERLPPGLASAPPAVAPVLPPPPPGTYIDVRPSPREPPQPPAPQPGAQAPHFSTEVDVRDGETTELNVSVPLRTTH
jgi:hypothetical protein